MQRHIYHVIHHPSHTTRDMSFVRFSLSLQSVDLAQFFQDKLDTVEWLLAKKCAATKESKQNKRMQQLPVVDLLHSIDRAHLESFRDDFRVILRRLEVVKTQIQTIKQSFEARLASKSSEDQAKLNTSIDWMTRLIIVVMPMNLIAGFFGMNVPVPWSGESRHFNTNASRFSRMSHAPGCRC
jgi:Mg2+ and Co2+ transporter CorA